MTCTISNIKLSFKYSISINYTYRRVFLQNVLHQPRFWLKSWHKRKWRRRRQRNRWRRFYHSSPWLQQNCPRFSQRLRNWQRRLWAGFGGETCQVRIQGHHRIQRWWSQEQVSEQMMMYIQGVPKWGIPCLLFYHLTWSTISEHSLVRQITKLSILPISWLWNTTYEGRIFF